MTDIVIKGLTKTYDDGTEAVRSLDLSIPGGSFLVLLGPSGCGKSTLLRMIAGVEPITDGTIYFNDNNVTDLPAYKRKVSMVFQNFTLYPNLNVYRNLAFPLENKKVSQEEIDRRVKKIAGILGLTAVLNRKSRSLSGGQKQRTALGRALINEPDVFLLDEPLSNLDQTSRMRLRRDILEIHEKLGTTFIFVTHDQNEAMEMGTHIAVMNEGGIEQVGTPMQLYENPATAFVAGFLGRPKMNFLNITAVPEVSGWRLPFAWGDVIIPRERILTQQWSKVPGELTVGIRPENLTTESAETISENHDDQSGKSKSAEHPLDDDRKEAGDRIFIQAVVDESAPAAGAYQAQLHDQSGSWKFTALIEESMPIRGDQLILSVDPGRIYLFDAASGESMQKPHPVTEIRRVKSGGSMIADEEDIIVKEPAVKRFFKTFFGQFFGLMGLNILFILTCLGIITIPASITALCRVCIKMEEDENVFLYKDYMKSFKRDFKKSLLGGSILIGILLLLLWVIWLYSQLAQSQKLFLVLGLVAVFLMIGVYITAMYFFPMHAMIDLPVGILLQNSFVLACQGGLRTLGAFAVSVLSFILAGIGLLPYSFVYIVIFMFSLTTLVNVFIIYPLIRIRVIAPDE